jgi:DNA polymerase III epsilon subunit-like protein
MMDGLYRELILNGVPVSRVHKEPDESSAAELLSYLEFARSLNEWDIESALHFPRRCLTSLDEIRLLEEARIEGEGGLWAVLQRATRDPRLSPLSRKRIANLIGLVHEIPQAISDMGLSAAVHEAVNRIAASRPVLKRETQAMLKGAVEGIIIDPSLNINELRDKLLESRTLEIIFYPELMPFIAARIIAETAVGLFGLKVEMTPYSESLLIEPKKQPVIIIGLNNKQLHSLLPDILLSNIPCISDGLIHIPSSANDDVTDNHAIPLAAYALCSKLATPKLPDDPLEIVFVDLETTSVDTRRAEIVEIAAARYLLDAGHMRELNTFHRLVKPKRPIPQAASAVHGILDETVADAPPVEEVIEPLLNFIGDAVIAGHNVAEYDIPIIRRFAGWVLRRDIPNPVLDSLPVSRNLYTRVSHTLGALAEMMGVPLEDAHRALADVRANAAVMEKLLTEEAQSQGLEFSAPALNLLAAGYILDETAPDQLTEALAETAARYAVAHNARIDGLEALADGLDETHRAQIGELASFIRSRPIIEDEDDERFEFMRRCIEGEALRFTEKNPGASLGDFLDYYALLTDDDFVGEEEAIRLITLHTAKGLEFDTVIIIGLEQGSLPHYLSIDYPERIEEERRLFYVGLTRASRKVYLTYVRQRDGIYRFPSMFLSELPRGLVKHLRTPKK